MTCEVVVMNRRGIALAADSAVSSSNGEKVLRTAEKLFPVGRSLPVAIMTFGDADFMGVPWEVIIADYNRKLSDRRFLTLQDHFYDFTRYVACLDMWTSVETEEEFLEKHSRGIWSTLYGGPLKKMPRYRRKNKGVKGDETLQTIVLKDHPFWEDHTPLEGVDVGRASSLILKHQQLLENVAHEVFEGIQLSSATSDALNVTVRHFLTRTSSIVDTSNIVFCGYGEDEIFPSLIHCAMGSGPGGIVRWAIKTNSKIGPETSSAIFPFGQSETIDLIIDGIDPKFVSKLIDATECHEKIGQCLYEESKASHSDPFMTTTTGLPRKDLADVAERLVSISSFCAKMKSRKLETVCDPIDVALVSKGNGFVWIKNKRFSDG